MVTEDLIVGQYEIAKREFPKLNQPTKVGEQWEIVGAIDVIDDEGSLWDTYNVKIVVPKKYPEELFVLHETGGKIPKELDWHNRISCCVSTTATIYFTLRDDLSLLNWLVKFAHPFLANHIIKKETGSYANGEFAHFTDGTIAGYERLFDIKGSKEVLHKLEVLCSVLELGRNDRCFCGSGQKFKNCYLHFPFNHKFSGIPYPVLKKDFEDITSYLRRQKLN